VIDAACRDRRGHDGVLPNRFAAEAVGVSGLIAAVDLSGTAYSTQDSSAAQRARL